MLEQGVDLQPHIVGIGDHPHPHVVGDLHIGGEAGDLAAAARDGDIGAHRAHPRPDHVAPVDGVAQGHVGIGAEATHIVHAGEPGHQGLAGVPRADIGDVLGRVQQGLGHVVGLLSVGQMHMHIDQPGQHLIAAPVHHRPGRALAPGPHRHDPPIHHLDQLVPEHDPPLRIHQAPRMDIAGGRQG